MNQKSRDTTHFGYRDVPIAEKQRLVGRVFSSVAHEYDRMNDLMSLGVHRLWKRHFAATSGVRSGQRVLDLAGGTGDVAALLSERVGNGGLVVLGDINADMLTVGRDRLFDRGMFGNVRYVRLNAEALPFPEAHFDAVTIAFGLRNVTDKLAALKEMRRVSRPGGKVLVLEFSEVRLSPLKPVYDLYSFKVLPWLGERVAGDADSYRYLAESIRKHPNQEALANLMREAGLECVEYRNLSAGIVAIHSGVRL